MDLSFLYGISNQSFFDSYWAAVHFASGILIGTMIWSLFRYWQRPLTGRVYARYGIIALAIWEYFEVFLRYLNQHQIPARDILDALLPRSFFEIETTTNILSDLILGSVGLYLAYRYGRYEKKDLA